MFDRAVVKTALLGGVCEITFEKTNGEMRVMTCTLKPELLPFDETTEKRQKAQNESVQPVYDIKASGWRSFRWDSLKEFVIT